MLYRILQWLNYFSIFNSVFYFTKFKISNPIVDAVRAVNYERPTLFRLRDTTVFCDFSESFQKLKLKSNSKFEIPNLVVGFCKGYFSSSNL